MCHAILPCWEERLSSKIVFFLNQMIFLSPHLTHAPYDSTLFFKKSAFFSQDLKQKIYLKGTGDVAFLKDICKVLATSSASKRK